LQSISIKAGGMPFVEFEKALEKVRKSIPFFRWCVGSPSCLIPFSKWGVLLIFFYIFGKKKMSSRDKITFL